MAEYIIQNFAGGLNEGVHASLIQKNEARPAWGCLKLLCGGTYYGN